MLKLRDIMTADVVTVTPEMSLRDAADLLARRHVSGAPVLAGGRVVGVVSASDIVAFAADAPGVPTERPADAEWLDSDERAVDEDVEREDEAPGAWFTELWADVGEDVAERMAQARGAEWNVLDEHVVEEVMTRKLWVLAPDESVEEALRLMSAAAVHRVIVMEGPRLAGVVSTMDIARSVAEHRLGSRSYAFDRDREFDDRGWQ